MPDFTCNTSTSQKLPGRRSVVCMTNQEDVREFLSTRRAKITPDQAGLPAYGGNRRVAGLRREEVALLAGVSVDYRSFPDVGHSMHGEQPDVYVETLLDWFRSLPS